MRNIARGFRPTATTAARRQPAGKGLCQRSANALTSERTFGAKHRRGLPPDRYYSRKAAAREQRARQKLRKHTYSRT
ncbi:MAG: hypothetical protein ACKO2L_07065, partial [Planctomycetaceae bacterium]